MHKVISVTWYYITLKWPCYISMVFCGLCPSRLVVVLVFRLEGILHIYFFFQGLHWFVGRLPKLPPCCSDPGGFPQSCPSGVVRWGGLQGGLDNFRILLARIAYGRHRRSNLSPSTEDSRSRLC